MEEIIGKTLHLKNFLSFLELVLLMNLLTILELYILLQIGIKLMIESLMFLKLMTTEKHGQK